MYFTIPEKKEVPKEMPKVFLEWVHHRIKKNLNAIIMFNGSTGSGKSYACIKLALDVADMLGTSFTVKNNLAFKFRDLLEKMQLPQNQIPGTAFVSEEIGAMGSGGSSREWQSEANKFFFSFLQTSRHRNQILIINCPSFAYLEKGSRELVHFQFEAMGVDQRKKQSFFKPFCLQVNRRTGRIYFKYLRYNYDGVQQYMSRMKFGLPPKDMIREYEKLKLQFTTQLNQTMLDAEANKPSNVRRRDVKKSSEIIRTLAEAGRSSAEISSLVDLSQRQVQRHLRQIKDRLP